MRWGKALEIVCKGVFLKKDAWGQASKGVSQEKGNSDKHEYKQWTRGQYGSM